MWLLRLVQCMGCLCSLGWLWWLLLLVADSYFLRIVDLVGYLWSRIRLLMVRYCLYYDGWNSSLCCYLMVGDVGKLFVWFGLGRRCCLGLCWLVWNCFLGRRLPQHRCHLGKKNMWLGDYFFLILLIFMYLIYFIIISFYII